MSICLSFCTTFGALRSSVFLSAAIRISDAMETGTVQVGHSSLHSDALCARIFKVTLTFQSCAHP